MSETIKTPTTTEAKQPKSHTVTLADSAGATLKIIAERRSTGAVTFAVHTTKDKAGKAHNERGTTQQHPTFEAAVQAVDKLAAKAIKDGWTRREPVGGFVRKPDMFTELPRPAQVKGKKVA